MSATFPAAPSPVIEYPDSDDEPMAENTIQYRWNVTIKGGIEGVFLNDPNVFVAGDLFWYPVEHHPEIRRAPDVLVAFGRPKGDRMSYMQWVEDGVPPQVVFEVLSPSNRGQELRMKFEFYDKYGVEEYYIYDPEELVLEGWLRVGDRLEPIETMNGWVSPRLGVRFSWVEDELRLLRPDGRAFESFEELLIRAEEQQQRAEQEQQRAEREQQRADAEGLRADAEMRRREEERKRADRLAERLRSLGIDPESV